MGWHRRGAERRSGTIGCWRRRVLRPARWRQPGSRCRRPAGRGWRQPQGRRPAGAQRRQRSVSSYSWCWTLALTPVAQESCQRGTMRQSTGQGCHALVWEEGRGWGGAGPALALRPASSRPALSPQAVHKRRGVRTVRTLPAHTQRQAADAARERYGDNSAHAPQRVSGWPLPAAPLFRDAQTRKRPRWRIIKSKIRKVLTTDDSHSLRPRAAAPRAASTPCVALGSSTQARWRRRGGGAGHFQGHRRRSRGAWVPSAAAHSLTCLASTRVEDGRHGARPVRRGRPARA